MKKNYIFKKVNFMFFVVAFDEYKRVSDYGAAIYNFC